MATLLRLTNTRYGTAPFLSQIRLHEPDALGGTIVQDRLGRHIPLRTAPSIVAGQPEAVQSPAQRRLDSGDTGPGRQRSTPGTALHGSPRDLVGPLRQSARNRP